MNIGEVIAALERLAAELPQGRATQVQVHICNGSEPGVFTPSIEVDQMHTISEETGVVQESFVVVQGHPHQDEVSGRAEPLVNDVEDVVAQWSADFAERGSSRPAIELDYTTEPGSVLVPSGDGGVVRFELTEGGGIRHLPGADDSVAAGCLCDPAKNNAGAGVSRDDTVAFVFRKDCPVHRQAGPGSVT